MNKDMQILFRTDERDVIVTVPPFFRDFHLVVKDRLHKSAYESYESEKDETEVMKQLFVDGLRKLFEFKVKPERFTLDLVGSNLTAEEKERGIDFGMEVVELKF